MLRRCTYFKQERHTGDMNVGLAAAMIKLRRAYLQEGAHIHTLNVAFQGFILPLVLETEMHLFCFIL